ncbi:hypothetical protein SUDANB58_00125 [Streptomyces sp. enrichment culture]
MASRRSRLLGVMADVRGPFHAELVEHLYASAEKTGYDLVLSTLTRTRDERTAVETLPALRSEALVLLGPTGPPGTPFPSAKPAVAGRRPSAASTGEHTPLVATVSKSCGNNLLTGHLNRGHRTRTRAR